VIKGCSWLGDESGRWCPFASADSPEENPGHQESETSWSVLVPALIPPVEARVRASRARVWDFRYIGPSRVGTGQPGDAAQVSYRLQCLRWQARYGAWAGKLLQLHVGGHLRTDDGLLRLEVETPEGAVRPVTVPFDSGCVLVRVSDDEETAFVRDPHGVIRAIPKSSPLRLPRIKAADVSHPAPDPQLARQIGDAASLWTRSAGKRNAHYGNVGFRCVKRLNATPETGAAASDPQRAPAPPPASPGQP